ncbi:prolyl oligopeptidase family serine peptidase [Aliicoccus persicus]|uniref:Prolyl oligopeptidase family protein n=1 Tax=Aliicoccus persicus TaxID=930138 RepID=A0A662Z3E7_9STAP|nr:prolyl oligopeptidase family serine peptidase [Aliicoccus persicus]SEV79822.1 Prolyl oligopeptidase family protein [Aliicoccus persicus]
MMRIHLNNLNHKFLIDNNNKKIEIIFNNEKFYFFISLKENNEKLVVFSNGAVDRKKKTPPLFMRSTWHEDINANCIFIDDKTIHNIKVSLGWGIGREDRYYILDYLEVVKKIAQLINIRNENIFYYGSSAGGFMSIMLAVHHKNTVAIVNNPQTSVLRYKEGPKKSLFSNIFKGLTEHEIMNNFGLRISLIKAIEKKKNLPKIYYLQNMLSDFDMENHVNPFMDELKKSGFNTENITYIFYNSVKLGHNPLPKEQSLNYINSLIEFD